jgi:hypothetical protein
MRTLLLALLLVCACGKSKPSAAPPERCEADRDCPEGWRCLAEKCANPAAGAIYTDPGHAVTPDKVRDQVQKTSDEHEKNVDDTVKKLESE